MNIVKFTQEDSEIYLNLDNVIYAKPCKDKPSKIAVFTATTIPQFIDKDEFEKALKKTDSSPCNMLEKRVTRLTEAIDRLSMRIPSSIKMRL